MENRKFGLWLVFAALLVLSSCSEGNGSETDGGSGLLKEAFPWLKGTGRTEDMTPVEIELVDERSGESLRFRIPKAYLTDTANWAGGRQENIEIETGLPELEPIPATFWREEKPGTPEYEEELEHSRNGLFIRVRNKLPISEFEENVRSRYERKFNEQEERVSGLLHYESIACRDWKRTPEGEVVEIEEICRERGDEYFMTSKEFNGEWVAMSCTRIEVNSGGGCIVESRYKGRWITYIFRRNQLHRWQEFDTGVRALLDRFLIQPDLESPDSQG